MLRLPDCLLFVDSIHHGFRERIRQPSCHENPCLPLLPVRQVHRVSFDRLVWIQKHKEKGFEIPLRRSGLVLLAMCVEGRKGLQIPSPYFVFFDFNGGLEENRSGEVEDDTGVAKNNFENSKKPPGPFQISQKCREQDSNLHTFRY